VQVNALPNAAEAERLVKKLKSKGYPSYSVPRGAFFRVRVGSYPTRGEALAVKKRLEKEERYKDLWVDSAP
jgi:cell division septation protein DedD